MTQKIYNPQSGSALFLILIAVALFGALSYTVAGMMRSGVGPNIARERSSLYANEAMDYARTIRQTVQDMRISNGCSATAISFENPVVTGYTNGTNTKCQVFHANGGGLPWVSPSADLNDGSEWIFTGSNIVDGVGTTAPDLVLILRNINSNICDEINESSGITDTGNDADIDFTQFTGSYASTETIDFAADNPAGCLNFVSGGDNLFFYQVLVTR